MAQKGPPPPVTPRVKVGPISGTFSLFDAGSVQASSDEKSNHPSQNAPEALAPVQIAKANESDATTIPTSTGDDPGKTVSVHRLPIVPTPQLRSPRLPPPVPLPNPPVIPEAQSLLLLAGTVPPRIVIDSFRAVQPHEKVWAVPKRVGSMVPVLDVPGLGLVRYAGTIAVMVDSVATDHHSGEKTVYVAVRYDPDPGNGVLKRKFRSRNRERFVQLEKAIAYGFTRIAPECGLAIRLISGPPTMESQDMRVAGYTTRVPGRAPVRAEFTWEAVENREAELKQVYKKVQKYHWIRKTLLLTWWRVSNWFKRGARLAAYRAGERLVLAEGSNQRLFLTARRCPVTARDREIIQHDVAELAKEFMASFSALLWGNPILKQALVLKGVKVEAIAGTQLGTIMKDDEDESET